MAFATSFGHLVGLRILLGFFEGVTYPIIYLLIATFYRRSEQVFFFGVMVISNSVALITGGFIGVGITKIPTASGIVPWQWAFMIFGAVTMFLSIVYFLFLPDKPTSRWFNLTKEEEVLVEQRKRDNAVVRVMKIKHEQIWESLKEPRLYCCCVIALLMNLQNGALTTFSGIITTDMGFSTTDAMLLGTPSGVIVICLMLVSAYISKKKNEIIYIALGNIGVSLIGLVCLAAIPGGGAKLIGLYLAFASAPVFTLLQTSVANNVSGYTKKIFYTSCNLACYTFGNFTGPLLLRSKDKPRYLPAMGVYIAGNVISALLFAYLRWNYVRINKKRRLNKDINVVTLPDEIEDLTDVQNENFVYRP
jgi:MFS family permease